MRVFQACWLVCDPYSPGQGQGQVAREHAAPRFPSHGGMQGPAAAAVAASAALLSAVADSWESLQLLGEAVTANRKSKPVWNMACRLVQARALLAGSADLRSIAQASQLLFQDFVLFPEDSHQGQEVLHGHVASIRQWLRVDMRDVD